LLSSENAASKNTKFDVEPGRRHLRPWSARPDDPVVRQLERDTAAMAADNLYTVANEKIVTRPVRLSSASCTCRP
jgi:hypothetical protein